MILINGVKFACEVCIRGHRASSCNHKDRKLVQLKRKGRPSTQCPHCKERRKLKNTHVACGCSKSHDLSKAGSDDFCDCIVTGDCSCCTKMKSSKSADPVSPTLQPSMAATSIDEAPSYEGVTPSFIEPRGDTEDSYDALQAPEENMEDLLNSIPDAHDVPVGASNEKDLSFLDEFRVPAYAAESIAVPVSMPASVPTTTATNTATTKSTPDTTGPSSPLDCCKGESKDVCCPIASESEGKPLCCSETNDKNVTDSCCNGMSDKPCCDLKPDGSKPYCCMDPSEKLDVVITKAAQEGASPAAAPASAPAATPTTPTTVAAATTTTPTPAHMPVSSIAVAATSATPANPFEISADEKVAGEQIFEDFKKSEHVSIEQYMKAQSGNDFLASLGLDDAIRAYNAEEQYKEEQKFAEQYGGGF